MSVLASKIKEKIKKIDNRLNRMENVTYPDFLNTKEKYDECVQNIRTVKEFEDVFHRLLADDTVSMLDMMKIMGKLEADTIATHGNNDVSCILDMAEAIINYEIITQKEQAQTQLVRKQTMTPNEDHKKGKIVCDCGLGCNGSSDSDSESEEESTPRRNTV